VDNLRQEMLDAGVRNYQITIFGAAAHGFTDPEAARLRLDGVEYDALSNDLSWSGTLVLLQNVFGRADPPPPPNQTGRRFAGQLTGQSRTLRCPESLFGSSAKPDRGGVRSAKVRSSLRALAAFHTANAT